MEKTVLAVIEDVLDVLHGGISIADSEGYIIRLGKSCEEMYGIDDTYIGKHLSVLEEEGIFRPSLTLIALKERRKVTMTQPDKNGTPLLVTSTPIFDPDSGDLLYAISYASWDIKNGMELQERYSQLLREITRSNLELESLKKRMMPANIISESPQMAQIVQLAEKVADVDVEVLVCGEAGSGKSNLAKYIHQASSRSSHPFGIVNCGTVSGEALEGELFGTVKVNAKTGEEVAKAGLCEALNTGTLLLEDIDGMGRRTQGKLLHMLKNKHYYKQNGDEAIPVDLRVIATTRRDSAELATLLEPGLFYRLTVVTVDMPSLKNRKEDIPGLVRAFLRQYNEKYQKSVEIAPATMELLALYPWPGNVAELKCLIQQLVLTIEEDTIRTYHLPDNISPFSAAKYTPVVDLNEYLDYYEERLILQAYDKCKTTVKLAKYLGISQPTAVRKLQKYLKKNRLDKPIQN